MKVRNYVYSILGVLLALPGLFSCGNDFGNTGLGFSTDTLFFDTVFTQMGTDTRVLKLYNKSADLLRIDEIRLGGGSASVFRFNADGEPGPVVTNLEIEPGDSAFVFIELTLDPNLGNQPLIHLDSMLFTSNGTTKQVILAAWGQDGIYFYPTDTIFNSNGSITPYSVIPCNTVWAPGKPYVIVGYALVNENCKLTIQPGTQVHFFNNGGLGVLKDGSLEVLGDAHNPVVFQGTRLGYDFSEDPGQWNGLNIQEGGTGNLIRNAVIKNARIGITLVNTDAIDNGTSSSVGNMTLENVKILNHSAVGIYSIAYNIDGYNVLTANCGQYCGAFTFGGDVRFTHSTFANFWSGSNRQTPALFMNNFFVIGETAFTTTTNYDFRNSIVYGSLENEIDYDTIPGTPIDFLLDHCLLKIDSKVNTSDPTRYNALVKNKNPYFRNPQSNDFTIPDSSFAKNMGDISFISQNPGALIFDLRGNNRTVNGAPDAGAFEAY